MSQDTLQTFHGKSVAEAMLKVRAALGSEAIVVEKKEVRGKKSLFKLGGEPLVEIIATCSMEAARGFGRKASARRGTLLEKTYGTMSPSAPATKQAVTEENAFTPSRGVQVELQSTRGVLETPVAATPSMGMGAPAGADDFSRLMAGMREEILRLSSLQARGGTPAVGENLLDAYQILVENEVNATIARELVEDVQRQLGQATLDRYAAIEGLCLKISQTIRTAGGISADRGSGKPKVAAICGPTGCGKTTTLVKIAFEMAYNKKYKVGLINEDFRRPGAAAQLQMLTQIMDLPLVSVDTPQRMSDEIRNMQGLDLILIDTAGRGAREDKSLGELQRMLQAAGVDESHLVLPCSCTERTALSTSDAFRPLGMDRIILSKLDEAPACGVAVNIARNAPEPLSYVALGQKWSDGLREADSLRLARLICGLEGLQDGFVDSQGEPGGGPSALTDGGGSE